MKWRPPSIATTDGSPDHCWSEVVLRKPIRSRKWWPPSREKPTPVAEARRRVAGEKKNPDASFQSTITEPSAAAAIADSDCPAATSSCGLAASTFEPNAGFAAIAGWAAAAPADG